MLMKGKKDAAYTLLQVIGRHVLEVDLLCTVDVGGISKNANRHSWPGNTRQLYSSREAFVSLRVVVFQPNLEFHGFDKVAALFSRGGKELLDRAPHT